MIDRVTSKIKRYPFQTGIAVGIVFFLLIFLFFSLFQDHGKTLSGNSDIIQEDYLRMTINEFGRNNDSQLAIWRYKHLGNKAGKVLNRMQSDATISPQLLVKFAEAVNQTEKIGGIGPRDNTQPAVGTPVNPHKGLSGVGKVLLIILGLVVLCAGGFYAVSLLKSRKKQKRREDNYPDFASEPINMITPEKAKAFNDDIPNDTLFDLDALFSQDETKNNKSETDDSVTGNLQLIDIDEKDESDGPYKDALNGIDNELDSQNEEENIQISEFIAEQEALNLDEKDAEEPIISENINSELEIENEIVNYPTETLPETGNVDAAGLDSEDETDINSPELQKSESEANNEKERVPQNTENEITTEINPPNEDDGESDNQVMPEKQTEKPLVETDPENESENEDELLKMIRAGKENSERIIEKSAADADNLISENTVSTINIDSNEAEDDNSQQDDFDSGDIYEEGEDNNSEDNNILIHYQSQYRVGNDMYDEVFSIDQGDVFRGECGIGIGETLNNTEPKAVTAFEVWLFDKDDIRTDTWYLMSDFALSNDGIRQRLEQRGKNDLIRKGDLYTLETKTLIVEIKILELEYGNEMSEKNSYFTNVVFDVIAKNKQEDID